MGPEAAVIVVSGATLLTLASFVWKAATWAHEQRDAHERTHRRLRRIEGVLGIEEED